MPTSLCPPYIPHAPFSRRSFFALAATAASYAALGPVAFEGAPLDRAGQHHLFRQARAAEIRNPQSTIEGILGATRCALDELKAHYERGGLGDETVKKFLNSVMQEELRPIRERREMWAGRLPEVYELLRVGSEKARAKAAQTLAEVRHAMRIDYFDNDNLLK